MVLLIFALPPDLQYAHIRSTFLKSHGPMSTSLLAIARLTDGLYHLIFELNNKNYTELTPFRFRLSLYEP